jgi:hypothetical protein
VGCDVYEPYLPMLPPNIYDVVVQASGTHLPFRDRCFNNVVSIAVIEHLEKESGVQMLREIKRVAKRLTVIMTSRGFIPKNADDNPYQMHCSGWNSKDFKSRGDKMRFLPDFGDPKWILFPFVVTYIFGVNAKLLMAFKYKTYG